MYLPAKATKTKIIQMWKIKSITFFFEYTFRCIYLLLQTNDRHSAVKLINNFNASTKHNEKYFLWFYTLEDVYFVNTHKVFILLRNDKW